jgi:hypothetical protein
MGRPHKEVAKVLAYCRRSFEIGDVSLSRLSGSKPRRFDENLMAESVRKFIGWGFVPASPRCRTTGHKTIA